MIVYKWVIKYGNKYYPIINNGAYKPFDDLPLDFYQKGNTIKNYINPNLLIPNKYRRRFGHFHREGYHFWKNKEGLRIENYQKCMKRKGKQINCILKCYIRNKDIIIQDKNRLIAKKFRILGEKKITKER